MQTRLTGIILFVQDTEKLKAFYTGPLQLTVTEEISGEWVLLQAGQASVGLHKAGKGYVQEEPATGHNETNTKLVFEIQDDIYQVRESLLSQGVAMREVKSFDGYPFYTCDGTDPEGNVFQLQQRK